jgi:hypothetical protein
MPTVLKLLVVKLVKLLKKHVVLTLLQEKLAAKVDTVDVVMIAAEIVAVTAAVIVVAIEIVVAVVAEIAIAADMKIVNQQLQSSQSELLNKLQ